MPREQQPEPSASMPRLDLPTLLALASANGSVRLSGEAAFCAAVMAGVPTVVSGADTTKVTLTTAYPVDVWIDDGKIKVFSAPNNESAAILRLISISWE
jgi:hypothetical protein